MISSNIDLLLTFSSRLPIKVGLSLLIVLLSYLIRKLISFNIGIRHKIHNFYLNWFWITLYLLYYIFFILFLRYHTWGQTFDLKNFCDNCKNLWNQSTLVFIICVLLLLLVFLFMLKFRLFLLKEIRKRYIYQTFIDLYKSIKEYILKCRRTGEKYRHGLHHKPLYNRIITKIKDYYSYENLITWVSYYYNLFMLRYVDKTFTELSKYTLPKYTLSPKVMSLTAKIPLILLLSIFAYDCYFNNFLISKVFYYLPFYILYNFWFNITEFLTYTNNELNRIIYERYYEEDNVLYPESTKEENSIIENYLKNGLKCPSAHFKYTEKYIETLSTFSGWIQLYIYQRRFVRSERPEYKDRYVYVNPDIGNLGKTLEFSKEDFLTMKNSKED